jgi:hypothetical protein
MPEFLCDAQLALCEQSSRKIKQASFLWQPAKQLTNFKAMTG